MITSRYLTQLANRIEQRRAGCLSAGVSGIAIKILDNESSWLDLSDTMRMKGYIRWAKFCNTLLASVLLIGKFAMFAILFIFFHLFFGVPQWTHCQAVMVARQYIFCARGRS